MRWMPLAIALLSTPVMVMPDTAEAADSVNVKLRNKEANRVLNTILSDESYWADGWSKSYNGQLYDELRLKPEPSGYVPMITGEGGEDFPHDVVADTVFYKNTRLPKYMSGAKIIVDLGNGQDSYAGAPYRDTFYVLDLTLFYAKFPQRMYRIHDAENNRTVLAFEKLTPEMVDAATWAKYQERMDKEIEGMDTRWTFNSVIEVGEIYGMFMVSPGENHESRVTFISKLLFGDDAGWVAKMGSQMPSVLKAGLKSGFNASVAIAKHEKGKRGG